MNEMNLLRAALAIPVDCINNLQSDTTIVVNPIPPEVCQFIITDKHWLIENILCLLSNATKYSTCKSHLTDLIWSDLIWSPFPSFFYHPSPLSSQALFSHHPLIPFSYSILFCYRRCSKPDLRARLSNPRVPQPQDTKSDYRGFRYRNP